MKKVKRAARPIAWADICLALRIVGLMQAGRGNDMRYRKLILKQIKKGEVLQPRKGQYRLVNP